MLKFVLEAFHSYELEIEGIQFLPHIVVVVETFTTKKTTLLFHRCFPKLLFLFNHFVSLGHLIFIYCPLSLVLFLSYTVKLSHFIFFSSLPFLFLCIYVCSICLLHKGFLFSLLCVLFVVWFYKPSHVVFWLFSLLFLFREGFPNMGNVHGSGGLFSC